MSRAAVLSALVLYSLALYAAPAQEPRVRDPRVVVIFADVTSSLSVEQNKRVAELTKSVIVNLPPLTKYRLYLIQADPDVDPIDAGTIRSAQGPQDAKKRTTQINQTAKEDVTKIERRYCEINFARGESICRGKNISPRPQPDHRSCILGVMEHVAHSFLLEEKQRPIDLVFISDMVEDCDDTPLPKQSIRLINDDLETDILNVDQFRPLQSVGQNVRVTIVRPHVEDGPTERSARKQGLEKYWKKVFDRFGVDLKSWWWFDTTPPQRFMPDVVAN